MRATRFSWLIVALALVPGCAAQSPGEGETPPPASDRAQAQTSQKQAEAEAQAQNQTPLTSEALQRAAEYSRSLGGMTLVAMQGGDVVFEDYAEGSGPDVPARLASGTKSFWGVAAAAAVEDGLFALDENVADTLTEWKKDPQKSGITVRQLSSCTSGLEPGTAELRGQPAETDKFRTALAIPATASPGSAFRYGPSHLTAFGEFFKRKLAAADPDDDPLDYLQRRIFEPIGLEVARWSRDRLDNPVMAAGAYITAREWGKYGELINQGGMWNGKQVVDGALLEEILAGSPANPGYGMTLWLNHNSRGAQASTAADTGGTGKQRKDDDGYIYKDGPRDLAMAAGAGKQRMYIIPSLDTVIVRQGEGGKGWSDRDFLALALNRTEAVAVRKVVPTESTAPVPDEAVDTPPGTGATDDRTAEIRQALRDACADDAKRYCASVLRDRPALRQCLRDNRDKLSKACKAAVKQARENR